ncbi:hypothetical protein OG896_24715 [Streptomyces sp. NBC_00669]|nr:hypothetical protein [Streptomyces sp. NBC_00669]
MSAQNEQDKAKDAYRAGASQRTDAARPASGAAAGAAESAQTDRRRS